MASLADLFNPTFLMFLGILVLVVALLVVYFESKIRDQNHKIASMLSLVSTLAEDMNGVKMGLNHLAIRGGQMFQPPIVPSEDNLGNFQKNNLIEVSDDEESGDEDDEPEEFDENEDSESVEDDSDNDSDSEDSNNDIKVVKLQVSNEDVQDDEYPLYGEESNNLEFDVTEDLAELEGDFEPEFDNEYVEEVLDLKYDNEIKNDLKHLEESNIPLSSDLKTISINLGEEHQPNEDNIDYKKLQLAKLRSIAVEKGLTSNSEASKLKKPELLKLLGAE